MREKEKKKKSESQLEQNANMIDNCYAENECKRSAILKTTCRWRREKERWSLQTFQTFF